MENYRLGNAVGRGAYGTVYLSKRLSDGKEVIIKQIPVEQMSAMDRQGVLVEAKVLAMLEHPNIIEYYDNFLHDKAMMIVMEYAAGGNLFDFLETRSKTGGLTEDEVGHFFSQLILPMFYVHQNQILHRDLKSQNIFLTRSLDHLKIGDFGISKILSSKSKAFTVVGTPCYISPELCEGKPYNTKSDIWALGCILYELCTAKRAFEAPTLPALIIKIMRGVTSPIPDHFSPGVKQLLSATLAVDPNKRPSIPEIMAHHWLAPYLYRLHVSLGAIPCTSKPQRPMSVTRPENLDQPEDHHVKKKAAFRKRSPSPFMKKEPGTIAYHLQHSTSGDSAPKLNSLSPIDLRSDLVHVAASQTQFLGVESSGGVVIWNEDKSSENRKTLIPRRLEGITGINIVKVASGLDFNCLLTDRGILFTQGKGSNGCLGHGDLRDVSIPKIVEALLGDDIVSLSAGGTHVAVSTSDGDVFTWGRIADNKDGELVSLPQAVDLSLAEEEDIERVICGTDCTAVLTSKGRVLISGDNRNNRLFLDSTGRIRSGTSKFKPVLGEMGEIRDISISYFHSVALTTGGEIWTCGMSSSGDYSRNPVEVNPGAKLKKIPMRVAASEAVNYLASYDSTVLYWKPGESKIKKQLELTIPSGKETGSVDLTVMDRGGLLLVTLTP